MAEGVKALGAGRTSTRTRVGIFGTSYGGYSSLMCVLRHPEVFRAGSASSPPTAWYHYDSIYTERYMWIPQENKEGYEAGNAMTLRRQAERPAADLLRHGRQQRAPDQLDAADPGAAARRARASRCRWGRTPVTPA